MPGLEVAQGSLIVAWVFFTISLTTASRSLVKRPIFHGLLSVLLSVLVAVLLSAMFVHYKKPLIVKESAKLDFNPVIHNPTAADTPKSITPGSEAAKRPSGPRVEVGFALGAESIHNGTTECGKSGLICYDERQINGKTFEVHNPWRVIYRFRNVGHAKLVDSHIHVESSHTGVRLSYGNQPVIERQVPYVLEASDSQSVLPYSIVAGYYAFPVDVTIMAAVSEFNLNFKIYGDNMKAHTISTHFKVKQ